VLATCADAAAAKVMATAATSALSFMFSLPVTFVASVASVSKKRC
jgi:hypothetical protein